MNVLWELVESRWILIAIRTIGYALLFSYLFETGDSRFSAVGVLGFPAIAFGVAGTMTLLGLFERFPRLNSYLLANRKRSNEIDQGALTDNEWALRKAKYLEEGMRGTAILFAPAEEGLICVPVLYLGLSVSTACLGGFFFGLIHLNRFTYLECVAKGIIYTLVCYFLLPLGILTVAAGHLLLDAIGLVLIKIGKRRLSRA